jgi:hypothetical protein
VAEEGVRHALAVVESEKKRSLRRIIKAHKALRRAQREYEDALLEGEELGIGYTRIARAIGMSETGVRLFIKRHKGKKH